MKMGILVLKVESLYTNANQLWFFPMIKEYVHYVPVKADLSDLKQQIDWCREHDDECRKIAENSFEFYEKYLSINPILDYWQLILSKISENQIEDNSLKRKREDDSDSDSDRDSDRGKRLDEENDKKKIKLEEESDQI